MTLSGDGVGTYRQGIEFSDGASSGSTVVLYLRPSGRFLMTAYWPGYERSYAAGRWSRSDGKIKLRGKGSESTCVIDDNYGATRTFVRVLQVDDEQQPPTLIAAKELMGWSLLGWAGSLMYVGPETIIENDWGPTSLSAVDSWIEQLTNE